MLGAGDLVSHLHRGEDAGDVAAYRFSVFRLSRELEATHELRPSDLHDMVKLCQVLAFAIVDDGWIPKETSRLPAAAIRPTKRPDSAMEQFNDG